MCTICIRLGQTTFVSDLYLLHKVRSISSPLLIVASRTLGVLAVKYTPLHCNGVSTGKLEHIINVQYNEQVNSSQ